MEKEQPVVWQVSKELFLTSLKNVCSSFFIKNCQGFAAAALNFATKILATEK